MPETLNLPQFEPRLRKAQGGHAEIFDEIRRKYVRLTPEEWVRQHFIRYMVSELGYPSTLIIVEATVRYNNLTRRFDLAACDMTGRPRVMVECKAPSVKITGAVFDQAARYNTSLKVDFLIVTNGLDHYACRVNYILHRCEFLDRIPRFGELDAL